MLRGRYCVWKVEVLRMVFFWGGGERMEISHSLFFFSCEFKGYAGYRIYIPHGKSKYCVELINSDGLFMSKCKF